MHPPLHFFLFSCKPLHTMQEQKCCLCPEGINSHIHACKKQKARACLLHCFNEAIRVKSEIRGEGGNNALDVIFHCCVKLLLPEAEMLSCLYSAEIFQVSSLLYNFDALFRWNMWLCRSYIFTLAPASMVTLSESEV